MIMQSLNKIKRWLYSSSCCFFFFVLKMQAIAQVEVQAEPVYGCNSFQNKAPFAVKDSIVTFFLKGYKDAKQVFLAGNFTEWQSKALIMTRTDSGWIANVKLAPGRYLYKFITDNIWNTDPDNLLTESDPVGNVNSVYYRPNILFSFTSLWHAKKVYLFGSFNNWRSGELAMTKTPKGWELPLYLADGTHLYQFFAEGKGYPDPKNNNMIANDFGKMSSIVLIGKPDDLYLAFHSYRETVARDKEDKNKLADFYVHIGYIHLRTSHYTLACQSFQKALSLYQQLQNQDSTASMLFRIAITYKRLLDFPHQLEYLQKSFTAYEKAGNKYGMATVQKELGYYYADLPATPKAIEYFHKSLSLFEQLGKQIEVGQLLGNLGHMYLFMHDSAKSIFYLQKALKLNQQLGNKNAVGFNFWILGDYYFRLSFNISAAIDYLQKAQDVFEQLDNKGGVAYILFNLADILLYAPDSALERAQIKISEKYIRSIEYQKRGIEMMKDIHPEHLQVIHFRVLSETYEKIGLNDSAYHYYKQYIMRRDKVVDIEKQKAIVRLETRFENEKREDSLKLDKQLTDEKLQNQILLARQQQDLQQLAYLKTQAELQNEQLTSREKEKQLTLSEKEKQLQAAKVKTLTQAQAIAKLNQQRQWIYFGGVFLLLTLASVYFIYRWRVRSIRLESQLVKEKSEQQQKESEFQHKLADISLSALRSQMNP
ncbi:MAG TPA: hypothetical protein VJ765_11430, partial [Chitinophagaceae bacterium]|nr:hypothetical protein [Chitinophagaceae bacterium]